MTERARGAPVPPFGVAAASAAHASAGDKVGRTPAAAPRDAVVADSRTAPSRERVTAVPPQPTLGGPPPRRGDRWAAPSWPRRAAGDVSILAAAVAPIVAQVLD